MYPLRHESMHLWSRPTEPEDLAACAGLLPPVYKNVSDSLVQLWQRLLTSGGILSAVVGSPKPRSLSPVLAFGITYFVNDSLMQQIRRSRQPGLALIILEAYANGESPVLGTDAVARANASTGLNIVFHQALKSNLNPEQRGAVVDLLTRAFFAYKAGYHIKSGVTEAFGEAELPMHYAIGGNAICPQKVDRPVNCVSGLGDPYRIWLDRSAALGDPGSQMCRLFLYTPPKFHFPSAEQKLLTESLPGRTDEEVARVLGISVSAVKKRWQAIYRR